MTQFTSFLVSEVFAVLGSVSYMLFFFVLLCVCFFILQLGYRCDGDSVIFKFNQNFLLWACF